jgi:osmotically-inducible protein OsmY
MTRFSSLTIAFVLLISPVFAGKEKEKFPVTDDRIHDQVLMKLAGDQDVKGGGIEVEVKGGVVTLKGRVEKDMQKSKAEKLVKKVKGVTGVTNQLVVSPIAR